MHKAKSGKVFFYIYEWTRWQGESDHYNVITKEEAEKWVEDNITQLSKSERENCIKAGILSLEEDA